MSLRQGLKGLARNAMAARALPERAGAGAPIKYAPRPDKPLPLWYDLWWDNGVFPGQPAVDYMFGPLPANLTEWWYAKASLILLAGLGIPFVYTKYYVDEFRHPFVPRQYPPESRAVLAKRMNNDLKYDYSQPDYDFQQERFHKRLWTQLA